MASKTHTYFLVVSTTREIDSGTLVANSWFSERFISIADARKWYDINIRSRNKNDGHDAYYNKLPFIVEKVTETTELIFE